MLKYLIYFRAIFKLNQFFMKNIFILLFLPLLFSSCATIFNGKNQRVTLVKKAEQTILINNAAPVIKKGKYLLPRRLSPVQITVKQEGHKDNHFIVVARRVSPLYVMSFIPFGVIFLAPPLLDAGSGKAFNFKKNIDIPANIAYIGAKKENAKMLQLSAVALDIKPSDFKHTKYSNYKKYMQEQGGIDVPNKDSFQLSNTVFTDQLNDILKEKGYIDTTNRLFQGNAFLNTISIEATVKSYKIIEFRKKYDIGSALSSELEIKWVVNDSYKKAIYTQNVKVKSGQFLVQNFMDQKNVSEGYAKALKDALEIAFIEFINSEKMQALLMDKSNEDAEANFEELAIAKPTAYVANMQDAVKASVTIKPVKGHGSGFFITSDGYIITNYHVVSDTGAIKVITNDDKTYDAKIVRVSKVHDLALLKINIENVLPFQLNTSKEIEIASEIYAIGTPSAEDLSQTVSKGIISSTRKIDDKTKLIQTDVSVNAGNSGGVLTNKSGLALGVVTSKLQGIGIEGVAFAIPAYLIFDALKISVK